MQCILLPTAIAKLRPKLTVPLTLKQAQLNLKGQKPNTVEPYGMPPTLQATASRKLRGGGPGEGLWTRRCAHVRCYETSNDDHNFY